MPPREPAAIGSRGGGPVDDPAAIPVPTQPEAETAPGGGTLADAASPFPVQTAKVQEPPLRDATLTRERLLDWLRGKIHHRVILVTAEAGYGKTTLLADFSRRSRHRTLWYRLDEGDQSWAGLLSYLIAAGREFLPEFAPVTASLLREIGPTGPSRESVVATFMRELGALSDKPSALVIDDVHLVDHTDDVAYVLRRLVERLPARMTLVLVSRRPPTLPLGRLRGQGEVAELTGADLRFDDDEIEQLFRESYRQPLEPDVLLEVSRRTEGWAASLELIHAALRDRPPSDARGFVAELSGSRGEVYDYLAEEIVGDLEPDQQRFLMRTAILETLEPELVALATDLDAGAVHQRIEDSERLGLVARRATRARGAHRYHPLVREFLETRLRADIGPDAVADLHRKVAHAVEDRDWATACRHFAAAGDAGDIHRVIEASIARIMATGDYAQAESIIDRFPADPTPSSFDIIRSRMELRRGREASALKSAHVAVATSPGNEYSALNLASVLVAGGMVQEGVDLASKLAQEGIEPSPKRLAGATVRVFRSSVDVNLDSLAHELELLATEDLGKGNDHYAGVALLNLANARRSMGDPVSAAMAAQHAIVIHEKTGSVAEQVAAQLVSAWTHAHLGRLDAARATYRAALANAVGRGVLECVNEASDIETWYGEAEVAARLLQRHDADGNVDAVLEDLLRASRLQYRLRVGAVEGLLEECTRLRRGEPSTASAQESRRLSIRAHVAAHLGLPAAREWADEALRFARRQSASFWVQYCELLRGYLGDDHSMDAAVADTLNRDPAYCSVLAELVVERLDSLASATKAALQAEVVLRPHRWRPALRAAVDSRTSPARQAAEYLEIIGTKEDVARLRALARSLKQRGQYAFGLALARRLADRVFVEDQGRVILGVGDRTIPGTEMRRKVLALLCFLLSRAGRSATRDEVLEALWPDLEPLVALNSLNQTVYFLRRVFEPGYKEQLSPGYVHHASDVVWLDPELIDSRSVRCSRLLENASRDRTQENVDMLSDTYRGKFALDFAYEEWASAYRESMHAGYLQVIEGAISDEVESGGYERGIALARRAIEIDPEAEELELSLLRLYRGFGAAAAAAEQYSHYATMLREGLGVEPPPLEAL